MNKPIVVLIVAVLLLAGMLVFIDRHQRALTEEMERNYVSVSRTGVDGDLTGIPKQMREPAKNPENDPLTPVVTDRRPPRKSSSTAQSERKIYERSGNNLVLDQ